MHPRFLEDFVVSYSYLHHLNILDYSASDPLQYLMSIILLNPCRNVYCHTICTDEKCFVRIRLSKCTISNILRISVASKFCVYLIIDITFRFISIE